MIAHPLADELARLAAMDHTDDAFTEKALRAMIDDPDTCAIAKGRYREVYAYNWAHSIIATLILPNDKSPMDIMLKLGDEYRERGYKFNFAETFRGDTMAIGRPQ